MTSAVKVALNPIQPTNQHPSTCPDIYLRKKKRSENFVPFNSLPKNKIFNIPKLKEFADHNLHMKLVYDMMKKSWEKEKILLGSIFSCSHSVIKRRFCLGH